MIHTTHLAHRTNQPHPVIGSSSQPRPRRILWTAALVMASAVFGFLPGSPAALGPLPARAQNFSQRIIQGKVQSDQGPVTGATVFLKNVKTRNLKSFTSTPDGSYRFAQVGMVDDFEVWAEMGSKKSAVKTVSSFDSRKSVDVELKLK